MSHDEAFLESLLLGLADPSSSTPAVTPPPASPSSVLTSATSSSSATLTSSSSASQSAPPPATQPPPRPRPRSRRSPHSPSRSRHRPPPPTHAPPPSSSTTTTTTSTSTQQRPLGGGGGGGTGGGTGGGGGPSWLGSDLEYFLTSLSGSGSGSGSTTTTTTTTPEVPVSVPVPDPDPDLTVPVPSPEGSPTTQTPTQTPTPPPPPTTLSLEPFISSVSALPIVRSSSVAGGIGIRSRLDLYGTEERRLYGAPVRVFAKKPFVFVGTRTGYVLRLERVMGGRRFGGKHGRDGMWGLRMVYGGRILATPQAVSALDVVVDDLGQEGRLVVSYAAIVDPSDKTSVTIPSRVLLWDLRRGVSVGELGISNFGMGSILECRFVSGSEGKILVLLCDTEGTMAIWNQKSGKFTNLSGIVGAGSEVSCVLTQEQEQQKGCIRVFCLTNSKVVILEYRAVVGKIVVIHTIPLVTPSDANEVPYASLLMGGAGDVSVGVIAVGYGSYARLYKEALVPVEEGGEVISQTARMEMLVHYQLPEGEKVASVKSSGDVLLIFSIGSRLPQRRPSQKRGDEVVGSTDPRDPRGSQRHNVNLETIQRLYVVDSFDPIHANFVTLRPEDGLRIPLSVVDLTYAIFRGARLYHSSFATPFRRMPIAFDTTPFPSWRMVILGTKSIVRVDIPDYRKRLQEYFFKKGNWIAAFDLLCYDYYHGLPLVFGRPSKEQIALFATEALFQYLDEKVQKGEDAGDHDDDSDENDDGFTQRLEKVFTYLVHIGQHLVVFGRLYEAAVSMKAESVFYKSLFRHLEGGRVTSVPPSHLDEFFQYGQRQMSVSDFAGLLTKLDVSENSPVIVDKLIEKCRLSPELYGCFVTVHARGKRDFVTPLRFLMERLTQDDRKEEEEEEGELNEDDSVSNRRRGMIRRELLHVLRLAYAAMDDGVVVHDSLDSSQLGTFHEVVRFLFDECVSQLCADAQVLSSFLELFFQFVRRQLFPKPIYEAYVMSLIRVDPKEDSAKALYSFLARIIYGGFMMLRNHALLEKIVVYLLQEVDVFAGEEEEEPDDFQSLVINDILVKTDPLLQEHYGRFIQLAKKAQNMDTIIILLCERSGDRDDILRNLLHRLEGRSEKEMERDVDFLLLFKDRVRWIYEELIDKLRATQGEEQHQTQIFLQKFLTRIVQSKNSELLGQIIDDEEFHLQYLQLLVNHDRKDTLVSYLMENYDRLGFEAQDEKLKRLLQIIEPVLEARAFVCCRLGRIEEVVRCVMATINERKASLWKYFSVQGREAEKKLQQCLDLLSQEESASHELHRMAVQYLVLIRGIDEESRVMQRETLDSFALTVSRFEGYAVEEFLRDDLDLFPTSDAFDPLSVSSVHIFSSDRSQRRIRLILPDVQSSDEEMVESLLSPAYLDLRNTLVKSLKLYLLPSTRHITEKRKIHQLWFSFLTQSFLQPLIELQYGLHCRPLPRQRRGGRAAREDDGLDDSDGLTDSETEEEEDTEELNPIVLKEKQLRVLYDHLETLERRLMSEDDAGGRIARKVRSTEAYIESLHQEMSVLRVREAQEGGGGPSDKTAAGLNKLSNLYLQRCFVDSIEIILNEMKLFIPPGVILEGILSEFGFVRFMQLRPLLTGLLFDHEEMRFLTEKTLRLLSADIYDSQEILMEKMIRGIKCEPRTSCEFCHESIRASSSHPVLILSCGHHVHHHCCIAIQRQTSHRFRPVCPRCHGDLATGPSSVSSSAHRRRPEELALPRDDMGNLIGTSSSPASASASASSRSRSPPRSRRSRRIPSHPNSPSRFVPTEVAEDRHRLSDIDPDTGRSIRGMEQALRARSGGFLQMFEAFGV